MSTTIPFPAIILETNGILYIGDGTRHITADEPEKLEHLFGEIKLPSGLVGFNYEKRKGQLLHTRVFEGGEVQSHNDKTWKMCEQWLSRFPELLQRAQQFDHPLFGIKSIDKAKAILVDQIKSDFDFQMFELNSSISVMEISIFQMQVAEAENLLSKQSAETPIIDNLVIKGENKHQLARKILEKNKAWSVQVGKLLKIKRERLKLVEAATGLDELKSINIIPGSTPTIIS